MLDQLKGSEKVDAPRRNVLAQKPREIGAGKFLIVNDGVWAAQLAQKEMFLRGAS